MRTTLQAAFEPDALAPTLLQGDPAPHENPTAAVAAALRSGNSGIEALFIERAQHPGDPWSGQMAFPGGRTEPTDASTWHTAARETLEELAIDLHTSTRLGRLADVEGRPRTPRANLRVTPHVCWVNGEAPPLQPNYEVAAALWVPLEHLADRSRFIDYRPGYLGGARFPGIQLEGGRVVWGLTLRMLEDLFGRAGHPLRVP